MNHILYRAGIVVLLTFCLVFTGCQEDNKTVAIQPYKGFDLTLVDTVASTINEAYGFEVITLPVKELPKSAYVNIKTPRYRADTLIRILEREIPAEADYIIGLTASDMSTTKKQGLQKDNPETYKDWGIFGLAYRPGKSCVVSTDRIGRSVSQSVMTGRLKKVVIHELGHNLGLNHCKHDIKCVMRDAAETVRTLGEVGIDLCDHCRNQLGVE